MKSSEICQGDPKASNYPPQVVLFCEPVTEIQSQERSSCLWWLSSVSSNTSSCDLSTFESFNTSSHKKVALRATTAGQVWATCCYISWWYQSVNKRHFTSTPEVFLMTFSSHVWHHEDSESTKSTLKTKLYFMKLDTLINWWGRGHVMKSMFFWWGNC